MKDAVDSSELTRRDLKDLKRKYGFPYMVIHCSDQHDILLRACCRAGVELLTDQVAFEPPTTAQADPTPSAESPRTSP
jgi:3-hydroxybenzoate 6-monooxygenase